MHDEISSRLVTGDRLTDFWSRCQRPAAEESPSDRISIAGDAASDSARSEAIRLALRELGYIEGQNIATDYRYAEGNLDRIP